MCKITNKTNLTKVTGYKVAIKIKGKYYSPFTGVLYEVGRKLPRVNKKRKNALPYMNDLGKDNPNYHKDMVGKTGVFKYHGNANQFYWKFCKSHFGDTFIMPIKFTLLKMTLGGDIHEGMAYCGAPELKEVYVGSEMLEIEEMK